MNSSRHPGWFSRARLQAAIAVLTFAVVYSQFARAQTFTLLHSFAGNGGVGEVPLAGLVRDASGNLYGTTSGGGSFGDGMVFRLNAAGKLTVLHNFAGGTKDGANPYAGLVRDAAGDLYGTTYYGGASDRGTVFRLNTSGKATVLYSFAGSPDGAYPASGLVRDAADNFYGTTEQGGYLGTGTVYKLDKNDTETVLYNFAAGSDGAYPLAPLVRDTAGNFYGTTSSGGSYGLGTVFNLDMAGKETVLYSFAGTPDGAYPTAGLVRDAVGNLYGTTEAGGNPGCNFRSRNVGCGTVFEVDTSGRETVLYTFTGGSDGGNPAAGLTLDRAENLYGTTVGGGTGNSGYGWGTVFKLNTSGNETVLYTFGGSPDGGTPYAGLISDANGNFYGTTSMGGANPGCGQASSGCGSVFKLDTTGSESVLYSFVGGTEGANPSAGLIRDAAGNLYGTTIGGGASDFGAVFKLNKLGKETVLYSFKGMPDGAYPAASLIRDNAGNLYGTTLEGGTGACSGYGCGTVFKIDTSGKETVLYVFCALSGCTDGDTPTAGMVLDSAGNFYGTTLYGGSYYKGTVFKLDTSGTETVLYSFTGYSDGGNPSAGLVRDKAGNLYGTTSSGDDAGYGTVFELDTAGKETVLDGFGNVCLFSGLLRDQPGNLYGTTGCGGEGYGSVFKLDTRGMATDLHNFTGEDGDFPEGVLVQDKTGNLYGTTNLSAGESCCGEVFKLDTSGTLTVLHLFVGGTKDGASPLAGLTRDADGNLYGTTYAGGKYDLGTVFKLTP
jgi:uncharacterized repeat protein (TIGR03803 family)